MAGSGERAPGSRWALAHAERHRPADFLICDDDRILAVGFVRYDSDRGAQEDDRTGGYRDCATEVLNYARRQQMPLKVIFLNDGPGLLLGSMW